MVNKLQRVFYRLSGHDARQESWDHEMALRNMRQKGIEIGKQHIPAPVISQGTCPRHPLVLLIIKGHGDFSCISCKDEERNTGPIRAQHPMMSLYNDARRAGAGPQTAVQMITPKLTRNLKEWKQEQERIVSVNSLYGDRTGTTTGASTPLRQADPGAT